MKKLEDYLNVSQQKADGSSFFSEVKAIEPDIKEQIEDQFISEIDQEIENHPEYVNVEEFPDYLVNDPEIAGYPDEDFQEEIYNLISDRLPKFNFTVKDLGAGRCDFYAHLMKDDYTGERKTGIDYFGIESNPNLCNVAKKKYPKVQVINNDFLDIDIQTDYTICIGSLNDDHGEDKWEYFNKTLNHSISNTNKAILFVLSRNMDGMSGFLDYPFEELIQNLPQNTRFAIDYSRLEDIYVLTVHIGGWN